MRTPPHSTRSASPALLPQPAVGGRGAEPGSRTRDRLLPSHPHGCPDRRVPDPGPGHRGGWRGQDRRTGCVRRHAALAAACPVGPHSRRAVGCARGGHRHRREPILGGRIAALVVAATYAVFTVVVVAARRAGAESCGCFGAVAAPPSTVHVVVNAASAVLALAAAVVGPGGAHRRARRPAAGRGPLPRDPGDRRLADRRHRHHRGAAAGRDGRRATPGPDLPRERPGPPPCPLAPWLAAPAATRAGADVPGVLDRTVNFLADRLDRRGFLGKAAVVGSAVVTAPLEFGLKPDLGLRGGLPVQRIELPVRVAVLRRLHRVLLHAERCQRLPAGHDHRRVVEGRRVAVLRRRRPLLPGLQRPVRLVRLRRQRRVQRGVLGHRLRLRAGQLQQPQGRLHPVPLRAVQPGRRAASAPSSAASSPVPRPGPSTPPAGPPPAPTRRRAPTTARASTSRSATWSGRPTSAAPSACPVGRWPTPTTAGRASGSSSTPTSCSTAWPSSNAPTSAGPTPRSD